LNTKKHANIIASTKVVKSLTARQVFQQF